MLTTRPVPLLWLTTTVLVGLHVASIAADRWFGVSRDSGVLRQLDLNAEANLTAWFGSFVLLAAAMVAAAVAATSRAADAPLARRWGVLAGLLLVMSVDESAQLHDLATGPLRRLLDTELGLFHFAWVLPGMLVVLLAALYLAPLVRSLDPDDRGPLLRAALVYVSGAVLLEMAGGLVVDIDVRANGYPLSYLAVTTVEEGLELVGAVLLVAALLHVAARRRTRLVLSFGPEGVDVDSSPGPAAAVDAPAVTDVRRRPLCRDGRDT